MVHPVAWLIVVNLLINYSKIPVIRVQNFRIIRGTQNSQYTGFHCSCYAEKDQQTNVSEKSKETSMNSCARIIHNRELSEPLFTGI